MALLISSNVIVNDERVYLNYSTVGYGGRPSAPANNTIVYNNDLGTFERYSNNSWDPIDNSTPISNLQYFFENSPPNTSLWVQGNTVSTVAANPVLFNELGYVPNQTTMTNSAISYTGLAAIGTVSDVLFATQGTVVATGSNGVATGSFSSITRQHTGVNFIGCAQVANNVLIAWTANNVYRANLEISTTFSLMFTGLATLSPREAAGDGNGTIIIGRSTPSISYSSNYGVTWQVVTIGSSGSINAVSYGNGTWIASGSTGTVYRTTNPLGTWSTSSGGVYRQVIYDDEKFIGLPAGGGSPEISSNGASWSPISSNLPETGGSDIIFGPRTITWSSIAYNPPSTYFIEGGSANASFTSLFYYSSSKSLSNWEQIDGPLTTDNVQFMDSRLANSGTRGLIWSTTTAVVSSPGPFSYNLSTEFYIPDGGTLTPNVAYAGGGGVAKVYYKK